MTVIVQTDRFTPEDLGDPSLFKLNQHVRSLVEQLQSMDDALGSLVANQGSSAPTSTSTTVQQTVISGGGGGGGAATFLQLSDVPTSFASAGGFILRVSPTASSIEFVSLAQLMLKDLIANIPSPGMAGRLFFASDTGVTYRDSGTAWEVVGNYFGAWATGSRPTVTVAGSWGLDTTLGKPVYWSGAAWKDSAGTVV